MNYNWIYKSVGSFWENFDNMMQKPWNVDVLYFCCYKCSHYYKFAKVFVEGWFARKNKFLENSVYNHTMYLHAPIYLIIMSSFKECPRIGAGVKKLKEPCYKGIEIMTPSNMIVWNTRIFIFYDETS